MKTSDEILIGGGLLAGLALVMWYGDKLVKDGSKSFAENLKLPFSGGINVTMPNISVGMPSINLGISGLGDWLNKAAGAAEKGVLDNVPGASAVIAALTPQPGYTGPTQPASSTMLSSANTNASRKASVEAGTFWNGGMFTDNSLLPASSIKLSTSAAGNGIWVTDPKVQGGGYYVQDNSMYGKAGMPAQSSPIVPSASSSGSGSLAEKSYHTRGYDGTVGGYRDYLNTIFPGQGNTWYDKVQSNPAGYGVV